MKVPHGDNLNALTPLIPVFISYILSFVNIGIYWNNHHHLFFAVKKIRGSVLWANLHLLFWLSIIPFVTGWMGENHFAAVPTALYGVVLLMAAIAYYTLQTVIISNQGRNSVLAKAIGKDMKGKLSPMLYTVAIVSSFFAPWVAHVIYVSVALMWLVPDRRIERVLGAREG